MHLTVDHFVLMYAINFNYLTSIKLNKHLNITAIGINRPYRTDVYIYIYLQFPFKKNVTTILTLLCVLKDNLLIYSRNYITVLYYNLNKLK